MKGACLPCRFYSLVSVLAVALLFPNGRVWGAASSEQITDAVSQLGDADFGVREEASKFLWSLGKDATPALRSALSSSDAEVAGRARQILDNLRYGITPETPRPLVDLMRAYAASSVEQRQAVVARLVENEQQSLPILVRLMSEERAPAIHGAILESLKVPAAPRVAIAMGEFDVAQSLLVMEAGVTDRAYAAWLVLRGQADAKIKELTPKAGNAEDNLATLLSYLYRGKGDLPKAIQQAKTVNSELTSFLHIEAGDWKGLIADLEKNNEPWTVNSAGLVNGFIAYYRLAGDKEKFSAAMEKIKESVPQQAENPWRIAKMYFLVDQPQAAVDLLEKQGNRSSAFEILASQWRCDEALALVNGNRKSNVDEELRIHAAAAPLLWSLGEKERAAQIADAVEKDLTKNGGDASTWPRLITMESKIDRRDRAIAHCLTALAQAGPNDAVGALLKPLFPRQKLDAQFWWRTLLAKYPNDSGRQVFDRLASIMEHTAANEDVVAWCDFARVHTLDLPEAQASEREVRFKTIVETLAAFDRTDAALACLNDWAGVSDSTEPLTRLGEIYAKKKDWGQAALNFRRAGTRDRTSSAAVFLEGWATAKMGNAAESKRLMDLANLIPLDDDLERGELAEAMANHGMPEAAHAQRILITQIGDPDISSAEANLRHLAEEAAKKGDFATAAALWDRCMLPLYRPNVSYINTSGYVMVPHMIHRLKAKAEMAAGNIDGAIEQIGICMRNVPGDVDVPIELVPELDKAGEPKKADAVFEQARIFYLALIKSHPESGTLHNSLAWLDAKCARKLEEAKTHALKAVSIDGKNPAFLDTLAEAQFRTDDKEGAIASIKKAIEYSPRSDYMRNQLRRFQGLAPTTKPAGDGEEGEDDDD